MKMKFKDPDAFAFVDIAWQSLDDVERVQLVSELMSRMSDADFQLAIDTARHDWLTNLNDIYLSLLYKHNGETEFEHPENWDVEGTAPEHIMFCNAFDELMMTYCTDGMRNEVEWSAVDEEYAYSNSFGVAIVPIY